ncbi:response regulator transcription factor [Marinobacter halodurans]|uniref:Response regulator transcription factor n=1 Tax=Marinobacter halodurans TaxID=2528979 RepID=A0ABY1ZNU8_9GAMM|nr:response regulator transcription factor [Marinobacter halodurans]TBW58095.1 response regulator transcription factor [Marinobacter halodurans]
MEAEHPRHLVIVDDEVDILDVLEDALTLEGYRVTPLRRGRDLLDLLERAPVDLIILDLRLEQENGLRVAQQVRERSPIPIMMLTGKGDETDRILGLEMAADDFLMKPFNLREVIARVRALLRRSTELSVTPRTLSAEPQGGLVFDGWQLNLSRRQLFNPKGEAVELTSGEFNLLAVMVQSPNRVLSRDVLLERTHGRETESFDRTIDVLVLRLRRKLEENPKAPRYIKTERGMGYRFEASVSQL